VDFTREVVRSRWEYYYDLSEETRALITFQQYLSLKILGGAKMILHYMGQT
jgi:hypothetical protein